MKKPCIDKETVCKKIILVFIILFLCAVGARAKITNGPILLRVYKDRAAVMWETDTKGPGTVRYGQGWFFADKATTNPTKVEYQIEKNIVRQEKKFAFIHKAWLTGLKPGKICKYQVAGPVEKSKEYVFRTVPHKSNEVKFVVYGDSRTHPETHRRLIEQIIKAKVDFVVHAGDLVSKGDRYEQWGPQFFEPLKGLAETVPVYIAKGDHEGNGGNFEKLLIPPEEKNDFGFNYGQVHYFCADNVSEGVNSDELLNTIATDAAGSKAQWKFVSYHIPSLNLGGHSSKWAYPKALPTLAQAGVDFVIAGNSHIYERFRPVAVNGDSDSNLLTCITSGGGGAPMYNIKPCAFLACTEKVYHFCLFRIEGNKLTLDTINIDGEVIDHLELFKTGGVFNKEYVQTAMPVELIGLLQQESLRQP